MPLSFHILIRVEVEQSACAAPSAAFAGTHPRLRDGFPLNITRTSVSSDAYAIAGCHHEGPGRRAGASRLLMRGVTSACHDAFRQLLPVGAVDDPATSTAPQRGQVRRATTATATSSVRSDTEIAAARRSCPQRELNKPLSREYVPPAGIEPAHAV